MPAMATQVMTPRAESIRPINEPSVRSIIEAARLKPPAVPSRGAWMLSFGTMLLWWSAFTPLDWSPLAWIALVPMTLLIRPRQPARHLYLAAYLSGLAGWLMALQWMRLADSAMYFGWGALALYLAVYTPLFVGLSRAAVHRFSVPLTLAVPVVWVGLEYLRAYVVTGFSWYYLGHTQYRWIELIQVSDLVGAYGVSFLVAMANACLAGLIPASVLVKLRLQPADGVESAPGSGASPRRHVAAVACLLVLFASVLTYGVVRRGQAEFREGPRVALVQGNFTTAVKHDPAEARLIFNRHYHLTGLAVPEQPDLIVWPETMYRDPLLVAPQEMTPSDLMRAAPRITPEAWRESAVPQSLATLSQQAGAAMVIGLDTYEAGHDTFRVRPPRRGTVGALRQDAPGDVRRVRAAAQRAAVSGRVRPLSRRVRPGSG